MLEIKHKAYWTVKQCNMSLKKKLVSKEYWTYLYELEELRLDAYENFRILKDKTVTPQKFKVILLLNNL